MNKRNITFTLLLSLSVFFASSETALALRVYVEKPTHVIQEGDTVLMNVFVDTESEEINALEGTLVFSDAVSVKAINTGGSLFSLWPVYPTYKNKEISFAGGTPSSAFGNGLHIFSFAVTPEHTGIIQVSVSRATGYKADGTGTALAARVEKGVSVPVANSIGTTVHNDLNTLYSGDSSNPQSFTVEYGRDKDVYNGKVFLSFYTTDNESGVVSYEVKEKGEKTMVYGNTYILKDQNYSGDIVVTAIDGAGNRRSETITFGAKKPHIILTLLLIGGLLLLVQFAFRYYKNKKNEKKS